MNKRLVLLPMIGLLAGAYAHASNYGMGGCGIGAMVFKDDPGKFQQIMAVTTNHAISPQTFAITSGTSNCKDEGGNTAALFIAANREALQKDVSRGQGETLANLSAIMGCSDVAHFGGTLQKNYQSIFVGSSSDDVSQQITATIKQDQQLAMSCGNVI